MKITTAEVGHIATLACLDLTETEIQLLSQELTAIVNHVEKLNQVSTENIPPTYQVIPIENVFREDEPHPSLPREVLLQLAPDHDAKAIRVPKIIETQE